MRRETKETGKMSQDDSHDEYHGACQVARSQGVVWRSKLHDTALTQQQADHQVTEKPA